MKVVVVNNLLSLKNELANGVKDIKYISKGDLQELDDFLKFFQNNSTEEKEKRGAEAPL